MLGVMLQKLWHKKWMVVCLLLGIVLLVATVVSFPMYRKAAYDRMLADEFTEYLETEGDWPARNQFRVISKRDAGGRTIARMEEFMSNLAEELGVKEKENIRCYLLARAAAEFPYERTGIEETEVRLAFLSGMQEHIKIAAGENLSESGMTEDGYVEALVSETALVSLNVMVGDTFCLDAVKDAAGNPIKVRITGVFQKTDASDFYWQVTKQELQNACLIKEEIFNENFCGEQAAQYTITCNYYHLFEYENLSDAQVVPLLQKTRYLEEESDYRSTMSVPPYEQILKDYQGKKVRIDGSLVILEIPVLILLAAFLFMISGQLYEMERNEISVLKSRGASGKQIFLLYLYQSIFLTGVGAILGIPLGFYKTVRGSRPFFTVPVRAQPDGCLYGGGLLVCGGCRGGMYSDYDNSGDLAQQGNHRKIKTAEKRAQKKIMGALFFGCHFSGSGLLRLLQLFKTDDDDRRKCIKGGDDGSASLCQLFSFYFGSRYAFYPAASVAGAGHLPDWEEMVEAGGICSVP